MHAAGRLLVLVALLVPSVAQAEPRSAKPLRTARVHKPDAKKPHTCLKAPVEVVAGSESATFSLSKCDGTAAPLAVDQLSILARPASAAKPKQSLEALGQTHGSEVAPGIRRVDPRLVERLELAVEHFHGADATGKSAQPPRVLLVSGYRPRSAGSYHQAGRALD